MEINDINNFAPHGVYPSLLNFLLRMHTVAGRIVGVRGGLRGGKGCAVGTFGHARVRIYIYAYAYSRGYH